MVCAGCLSIILLIQLPSIRTSSTVICVNTLSIIRGLRIGKDEYLCGPSIDLFQCSSILCHRRCDHM
ncbi:hypothetical protein M6B38_286145 [Iris pallida]|uniref:Secreted protein n=1 Tax=Iris pallida TaxID=29817 RepID=A0AAX6HZA0_IRIPA|nr:hypothetical protein M6B38_286145 [Iris pallida]